MKKVVHVVFVWLILGGCALDASKQVYQEKHTGEISGYGYDEYRLQLSENEQLTVDLDVNKLDVIIYSPISVVLENDKPISIEASGNYVLRVLMPRAFARRNEKFKYQLLITVNGS